MPPGNRRRRGDAAKKVNRVMSDAPEAVGDMLTTTARDELRRTMTALHAAATTMRTYRFGAKRLETASSLSHEQVWGQISMLYTAPLADMFRDADRIVKRTPKLLSALDGDVEAKPEKKSRKVVSTLKRTAVMEDVLEGQDKLLNKLEKKYTKKSKSNNPDRFYAFGRGNGGDDEEDEELEDEENGAAGDFDFDEEDGDALLGAEDEEGEADFDGEEGEEDEEGADADELDFNDPRNFADADSGEDGDDDGTRAALKEMYGDLDDEDDIGDVFDAQPFDESDEGEEGEEGEDFDNEDAAQPTPFEQAEQERRQRIAAAEADRIAGSWELQGEVGAAQRPRDALVDNDLDFEHGARVAPIITESLTQRLEARIKRRILEKRFDDVVRKSAHSNPDDLLTGKIARHEQADADAQKSKASLVDIYEKEFMEKQRRAEQEQGIDGAQAEPLTAVEQDELKALQQWRRLSQHLDALSNFYFTPRPAAADLDARVRAVQDQAPALSMESKGMFALSADRVLAPQDIFRPKRRALAGAANSELLPEEKRSLRRAAKEASAARAGRVESQKKAHQAKKAATTAPVSR